METRNCLLVNHIRGLYKLGSVSAIFDKGDNFSSFMFDFMYEKSSSLKVKDLLPEKKILSF